MPCSCFSSLLNSRSSKMCLDFYHTVTVSLRRTSYVFVFLRTDCFMKRRKKNFNVSTKRSQKMVCVPTNKKNVSKSIIFAKINFPAVVLWSVSIRRLTLVRDDVKPAIHIPSHIFFVFFFLNVVTVVAFTRAKYACFACFFFVKFHFSIKTNMQTVGTFEHTKIYIILDPKMGDIEAEKDECFGVFQWILPPMRLYNTHVRKPQVLAREMPVRMFDSSCVTLVLLKHFDTFANSMENWEWERVIQTHMLTYRTPCGCVATSMLQFGRTTKK